MSSALMFMKFNAQNIANGTQATQTAQILQATQNNGQNIKMTSNSRRLCSALVFTGNKKCSSCGHK